MGAVVFSRTHFFRLAVFLALALAGCQRESYSRSSSGFSSLDKRVLYDFRDNRPALGAHLDAAATRRVLSTIFAKYLSDARQCKPATDRPEPGQIVPTITSAAEGSFTAAGLKQTVYLVDLGECHLNAVSTTRRLAVFTANTLTANVEVPIGDTIAGAYDLNGDGKQQLLLTARTAGQAELVEVATLVAFEKDKLVTVEDFGRTYADACGTALTSKSITASLVYYLPPPAGQKPRFNVELYRAPCPQAGQAKQWTRAPEKY